MSACQFCQFQVGLAGLVVNRFVRNSPEEGDLNCHPMCPVLSSRHMTQLLEGLIFGWMTAWYDTYLVVLALWETQQKS